MVALTEPANYLKPPEQWIRGPRIFEPLITEAQWEAARIYLKDYAPRTPRDSAFWLAGLLHCPSGHRLHGWWPRTGHQPVRKCICNVHRKKPQDCPYTYHVKHDQVSRLVLDYLREVGADLEGLSLQSLYSRQVATRRRWWELREIIEGILWEKLPSLFHYRREGKSRVFEIPFPGEDIQFIKVPGYQGPHLETLFDFIVAGEQSATRKRLAKLQARHTKITASFVEATSGIRQALAQEAATIEGEISRLAVGLDSASGELRRVFQEVAALGYEVNRSIRLLEAGENHVAMGEAARAVIERIDCEFEVVQYPSGWKFSRLKGIRITPRLGEVEYRLATSTREQVREPGRTRTPACLELVPEPTPVSGDGTPPRASAHRFSRFFKGFPSKASNENINSTYIAVIKMFNTITVV